MKRSQLIFTTVLVPVDFLMLMLAAIAAYRFRIDSFVTDILPVIYALEFNSYLFYAFLAALTWLVVFALTGLYVVKSNRKLSQELGRIFVGCSIGLLVIVFGIFLQRELFSSRFIILVAWLFAIIFVFIGRALVLAVQRQLFKRGYGAIKLVIIGTGEYTDVISAELAKNPSHGFRVMATFPTLTETAKQEILRLHSEYVLDEIMVTDTTFDKNAMLDILDLTEEHHLGFRYAADIFNTVATNTKVEPIAGVPVIELRKTRLDGWGRVFKRSFDIFAALFFIILLSPILILTALAVRLTSPGPIIFKNERVGQKGKLFDTLKFRSMRAEHSIGKQFKDSDKALAYEQELIKAKNTRADGPIYKIADDPRLTRVGGFLRRWSFDELPQFFNVLRGDMSIVGPRPHQPREVALYDKHHKRLLTIKPGITGMAQVSGRSDLSFADEAKLDLFYIENWTPWLDIQIILKTPIAILKNRKAA